MLLKYHFDSSTCKSYFISTNKFCDQEAQFLFTHSFNNRRILKRSVAGNIQSIVDFIDDHCNFLSVEMHKLNSTTQLNAVIKAIILSAVNLSLEGLQTLNNYSKQHFYVYIFIRFFIIYIIYFPPARNVQRYCIPIHLCVCVCVNKRL